MPSSLANLAARLPEDLKAAIGAYVLPCSGLVYLQRLSAGRVAWQTNGLPILQHTSIAHPRVIFQNPYTRSSCAVQLRAKDFELAEAAFPPAAIQSLHITEDFSPPRRQQRGKADTCNADSDGSSGRSSLSTSPSGPAASTRSEDVRYYDRLGKLPSSQLRAFASVECMTVEVPHYTSQHFYSPSPSEELTSWFVPLVARAVHSAAETLQDLSLRNCCSLETLRTLLLDGPMPLRLRRLAVAPVPPCQRCFWDIVTAATARTTTNALHSLECGSDTDVRSVSPATPAAANGGDASLAALGGDSSGRSSCCCSNKKATPQNMATPSTVQYTILPLSSVLCSTTVLAAAPKALTSLTAARLHLKTETDLQSAAAAAAVVQRQSRLKTLRLLVASDTNPDHEGLAAAMLTIVRAAAATLESLACIAESNPHMSLWRLTPPSGKATTAVTEVAARLLLAQLSNLSTLHLDSCLARDCTRLLLYHYPRSPSTDETPCNNARLPKLRYLSIWTLQCPTGTDTFAAAALLHQVIEAIERSGLERLTLHSLGGAFEGLQWRHLLSAAWTPEEVRCEFTGRWRTVWSRQRKM